jgi:hypothetical protein
MQQAAGYFEVAHSSQALYDTLPRPFLCREDKIFGEIMQVLCRYFKRLADARADPPTFVFGKV